MPPVVIFASAVCEEDNRKSALRLGAAEFVSCWEDLIEVTQRLLGKVF